MEFENHMTDPGTELARLAARTPPGMAYFVATGPQGKTCEGCKFFMGRARKAGIGIGEKEREALQRVLNMLERGDLTYHDGRAVQAWRGNAIPRFFNMANWNCLTQCGTVCCIGGTAEWIGSFDKGHFHTIANSNLRDLLGIGIDSQLSVLRKATVPQAAKALRNYLTDGEARWNEVLAS